MGDEKLTYAADDIWGKHALGYFPANNFEATYDAHKAHNNLSQIQSIDDFKSHLLDSAQLAFLNNGSIYLNTYSNQLLRFDMEMSELRFVSQKGQRHSIEDPLFITNTDEEGRRIVAEECAVDTKILLTQFVVQGRDLVLGATHNTIHVFKIDDRGHVQVLEKSENIRLGNA
jgi:hypothetical protein